MLVGIHKTTGEKVYAFEDTEYIRKLNKNNLIICQECGTPLILKAGKIKIHHFAHYKCKCTYKYGEPESENHIRGKLGMYERLQKLYPNSKVELEYKVLETNQRADVMVIHPNGEKWAFEIQCSRITVGTLLERSMLYKNASVIDNWFLGYDYPNYSYKNSRDKIDENLICIMRKLFTISFQKNIEVGRSYHNNLQLDDMVLKKEDGYFTFNSMIAYKRSCKLYKMAINDFYKHLKNTYVNSNVLFKYKLEDSNEKADVILISKKTKQMCAFNFIFTYVRNFPIEKRAIEYEKRGITVFWLYGIFEMKYAAYSERKKDVYGNYSFDLVYQGNKWNISEQSGGYMSGFYLENLRLTYMKTMKKYKELTLKDGTENIELMRSIMKIITWKKFSENWKGYVYKCPRSTLEEHDLRIENISNCEKCKYFDGYMKKGIKKEFIRCKGTPYIN